MTDSTRQRSSLSRLESNQIRIRRRLGMSIKPPRGWRPGPPDFVGVGAQRSGTTWWFRQILRHSSIVAPWGKERHFFEDLGKRKTSDHDITRYHSLFPRPPGALTGEWTPRYMYDHWTPRLLKAFAPDARILILLRDPWDRFLSGMGHERRTLGRVLRGAQADYLRLMVDHDSFQRSLYADQVSSIFESFGRENVMVLQYEACLRDPDDQLRRTFEFLSLDENAAAMPERRSPHAPRPAPVLPVHLVEPSIARLRSDAERLIQIVPELDPALWPSSFR